MFLEYFILFKYLFICLLVSFLLFFISLVLVYQMPNPEKMSMYECGFSPFSDTSTKFEVSFYIVAMLFIIFDLEMVFLFPWVVVLCNLSFVGYFSMMLFLLILMVGFMYEWVKGALDWQ